MLLLPLLFLLPVAYSLTCYNGMKLLRMQSVGESVEECPASAYCYNMTASAALLARDKCISTTFQMVPVSLCCCSHDRCNVGDNPVFDQGSSGGNSGGWGGDSEQSSRGKWGGLFAEPDRGSTPTRPPSPSGGRGFSPKQIEDKFRDFDVDNHGDGGGGDGGEEVFEKVDVRFTTPPTRGDRRWSSSSSQRGSPSGAGDEIEIAG
ncbi:hypothetical protein ANCCAN_19429 [Ancylostoma caninum]|uniref:Uncharacterized protein n=1 Tax=Ancylostoma caninum TaxID=29170 RepID=A0A368FVB5_ANCCA|nr:hypothetical protein ANCCAN_19429 [Ancylostoma caninum]